MGKCGSQREKLRIINISLEGASSNSGLVYEQIILLVL